MDLAPILARLQSELTDFRVVGGAVDLDAVLASARPATPAAYLMPLAEAGGENTLSSDLQELEVTLAVILAVSNRRDATGAAAGADLEALRAQVRQALLGWTPDAATCTPLWFSQGRVLSFSDGVLWWGDEFRFSTYLVV